MGKKYLNEWNSVNILSSLLVGNAVRSFGSGCGNTLTRGQNTMNIHYSQPQLQFQVDDADLHAPGCTQRVYYNSQV